MRTKQVPEQGRSGVSIWRLLTEPLASSLPPEKYRRSAPLLAAFLLVLVGATFVSVGTSLVTGGVQPIIVVAFVVFSIAYLLSRTRHYLLAAALTVTMLAIPSFVSVLLDPDVSEYLIPPRLVWLVLPILLSSLLFNIRGTLVVGGGILVGVLLLPLLNSQLSFQSVGGTLGLVVTTSALVTSFIYYRNLLQEDRQAELRASEQRYRALFERTSDAVFIRSLDGTNLEANQQAADMLGYSLDELAGLSIADVVVPSEYDDSQERLAQLREGQTLPIYELTFRRKDGVEVPAEVNAALVYDAAGNPLHIQNIVRDITQRRRAEILRERLLSALQRRSTQLQTSAQISKSASMILDTELLINHAVNLIQKRFQFYYVGLFLVDEAAGEAGVEYAVLKAGTGEAGQRMLEAGYRLVVGGDSAIGWCVANAEPNVALDVGPGAVQFNNPVLPDTRSELALPLISHGQCIGALTVQSVQEAAFTRDDTSVLQTMADQLAIAIENARLYNRVRRHAAELEERVAERTAELAAVNKELEAFAYSVSHDLRAPLRSIGGFSQALLEDYESDLDAIGQDYLRRVVAASQHMGQLIDDLLQLSRLTRREMRREQVDLSALARSVAARLREAEPRRHVEFVIADRVFARGDERLLTVVLENLLGNAWKFTSRRPEARIEFGVTRHEGQTAYYVRDDGAGFDMTYAGRLFRPFQRLHSEGDFEGTGIGLTTVQRVVHRHSGRVWASGKPDQGATFYFTLAPSGERQDGGLQFSPAQGRPDPYL